MYRIVKRIVHTVTTVTWLVRLEDHSAGGRTIEKEITFPASYTHEAAPRQIRPARWGTVAAAVAASFLVGLLAEHLAHDFPGSRQAKPIQRTQIAVATTAQARASSDDEFLGQVEIAAVGVGPAALRPLDAMTPRAWDAR